MKKILLSLCGLFIIAVFFSCDENNSIGSTIQPGKDRISVEYETVGLNSETVFVDSVFLRNSVAMLGEFTDPTFGTTKSDFMAQLYCARNFSFPDDVKKIDSAYIYFYYDKWFGDSTAVHHLNVYELNKPLDIQGTFYSNIKAVDYFDRSMLLGQGSFTTGDLYTSDSLKNLSNYSAFIRIPVDTMLARRFLNDSKSHPEYFSTPENFQNYFKGIYVTTDYGNGSILYITHSEMEFCYDTHVHVTSPDSLHLRDSLVIRSSYFPVTKEVKQINRCEHNDLQRYLDPTNSDSLNYIFAPAGLFTKITVPDSIFTKGSGLLSGKTISSLRLKVMATQADNKWVYAMQPPEAILLINADAANVQNFFRKYEINDGLSSFLATYDTKSKNYVFDLSNYAQKMILEKDNPGSTTFTPFNEMLMIPVISVKNNDNDQVRLDHVMTPSAVKIRSGMHPDQPMKLEVIYTEGNK